jgi:RNA polymerase sigma-70 factor, ECF subfamily
MEVGRRDLRAEIEAVYRRCYGKFLRVAVAILRDEQLAEEAVHDAFVRALRHRRGFDERGSLEAWLWRIVVNEARRLARERRPTPLDESLEPATNGSVPDELGLRAWIAALPERQRAALFLRYYADLDYAAIADTLDITAGTVAATLNAARTALRRTLQEVQR